MKKLLLLFLTIVSLTANAQMWQNVGLPGFSVGTAFDQSIAVNNGIPYVAYKDMANQNKTTVMKFDGSDWVVVGMPGFSSGIASYQSLVFNEDTLYVAFRDDSFSAATFGGTTVMKFNGSAWVNVGSPGFSAGEANYQSLAFYDNIPYVAYQDNSDVFKTAVMKFEGGVWIPVGTPTGFSSGVSYDQSLAIDQNDGTPYVAFKDLNNSLGATVMKFDGNSWITVGIPGFSIGQINDPGLALFNGTPYVAFQDNLNGFRTSVMRFDGTNWVNVGTPGFSGVDAAFQSMVIYNGVPYVGFSDGSNDFKCTVMKYIGGAWENVGSAGFSEGTAAHQSLAIENGKLYIAYQDDAQSFKTTVMTFDMTTGINEQFDQTNFEIYPNPVNNLLHIEQHFDLNENVELEIINQLGQVVSMQKFTGSPEDLDVSNLNSGTYYLRLLMDNDFTIQKFIKL